MKWFMATSSHEQRHPSPACNLSLIPLALRFTSSARLIRQQSFVGIRCAADKGAGRAVEATVTTPLHPRSAQMVKYCLPPFSRFAAVCFNHWRGVGEAKVPAVTFRPAPGVTDTAFTSAASKQRETPASYHCLNQLFVVMSFHFGLGPAKTIRAAELHSWVHRSFAASCILQLIYQPLTAWGPHADSPIAANTAPLHTVLDHAPNSEREKGRVQLTNEEDQLSR